MYLQSAASTPEAARVPEFRVRLAVEADFPGLLAMGGEMHAENGIMPMNIPKVTAMIAEAIRQRGSIAGVIGQVGNPEAAILLRVSQFWYSEECHLEDFLCYVRPEFRKSSRAKSLIKFAKASAKSIGVPLLIGVASNKRTEAKVRLYRREVGDPVGALFLYNGKTGI